MNDGLRALTEAGVPLLSFELEGARLSDAFLAMTEPHDAGTALARRSAPGPSSSGRSSATCGSAAAASRSASRSAFSSA